MNNGQKFSLVLFANVLFALIILVFLGGRFLPEKRFNGNLAEILPAALPDWKRTPRPIAESPEVRKVVNELLNFDQGVLIDYTKLSRRISVYMAYWRPGRMSPRLIAGHNPDVCWVENGWTIEREDVLRGVRVGGRLLPATESRSFSFENQEEYVWFWHVTADSVRPYGQRLRAPWYAFVTDLFTDGINQRKEQHFIRISSNQPLDELSGSPMFQKIIHSLPLPRQSN